jgi:hypothetical protein
MQTRSHRKSMPTSSNQPLAPSQPISATSSSDETEQNTILLDAIECDDIEEISDNEFQDSDNDHNANEEDMQHQYDLPGFIVEADSLESQQEPFQVDDDGENVQHDNHGRKDLNIISGVWSSKVDCSFSPPKSFTGIGNEGPTNIPEGTSTPLQFWNLLITIEMIRNIVEWTNSYAKKWKDATPDQIFDSGNPLSPYG